VFLAAPLVGLAGATVASTILWRSALSPAETFVGDLIVVLYLLTLPAIGVILGAFASRNPLASLGGSREMKLVVAYELPFVLAALVPVIRTHSLRLGEIVTAPAAVGSVSGVIALLVAIVCMQAKLTLVPFDAPEAETELSGGAYIEYSGPPLALFKLTRAMMLFVMPVFLVTLFWGGIRIDEGWLSFTGGLLKYLLLVVLIVLIRNTAPRLRIDQIVKLFWGPVTLAALAAVALAAGGW
jgi:NADH-quinone oxidoreductase subunit H